MSASPFDPEFQSIARFLPRGLGRPWMRSVQRFTNALSTFRSVPSDIVIEQAGSVKLRVHRPEHAGEGPLSAILWLHGGGFLFGSPAQDDDLCRQLAKELGALVVAPTYRLAPDHCFPAAVEDAYDALRWIAARDDVDSARIAIAGASAGGGLAAQLALHAREKGEIAPAIQALVYPMLDDRTALRTDLDERGFRLWDNRSNRYGWSSYLGCEAGDAGVSPIAAPARHEDLRGLPPAWIGVGTLDLFHDEDVSYAERLREVGVSCELMVVDGVFHAFDKIGPEAAVTRRFQASMIQALSKALATVEA